MKAEQPKPTLPAAPPPAGVPGMATEPVPDAHQGHEEPNALRKWLTASWEQVKAGQVGNPKWIALLLALVGIGVAWWYYARTSKQADSKLWLGYDLAVSPERIDQFIKEKSTGDTEAARLARVNQLRFKLDDGVRGLTAARLADRLKAAKNLEEVRDEFTKLADEFPRDRTMKASCLLAAADAELALVGVPKERGGAGLEAEGKANSRGKVEQVAALKRKAAEVVGADTAAGKQFTADAERFEKTADAMYTAGLFNAFNEPDPVDKPVLPVPPSGITPPGTGATPDAPKPPDKPLDPVNPLKTDDKKPDDGPKPGGPLPPSTPPTTPEKK